VSDYIGFLIGAAASAVILLIMHFIERGIARTKMPAKGSFPIAEQARLMRIAESKKLCEECKELVGKLDSLEPFDYRGLPSVILAFPVYDGSGQFKCHELCEYRDIAKPKYHGLCGFEAIREFRYPETGRWVRLGVVKKGL